jgi:hypothetical protein
MAVELTDEMRRAVHREDCERDGHNLDTRGMIAMDTSTTKGGTFRADIGGPDENTLPYMSCGNCGVVWLVWPQEFENYEAAVAAVRGLMKVPEVLKPKPRRPRAAGHGHGADAARDAGAG